MQLLRDQIRPLWTIDWGELSTCSESLSKPVLRLVTILSSAPTVWTVNKPKLNTLGFCQGTSEKTRAKHKKVRLHRILVIER